MKHFTNQLLARLSFLCIANHSSSNMYNARKVSLLFILTILSSLSFAQGTWTALTNVAPNANQGVMTVLSDGTVLCKTGSGGASSGNLYNKLTPNSSGSYANGTWSSIAPMNKTRRFYSSQVLFDGRLYVCGGEYGSGAQDGEIYNPATNTWTMITSPITDPADTLEDPNSEILEDGRILQQIIKDGNSSRTCRIYNPATNTWTNGGTAIYGMGEATWHKLPDGSIITVRTNNVQSQRYFPATNTWVADATVPVNLYSNVGSETGGAAMLPDGRIFFVGGSSETAIYTPSGTSAIGSWAAGPVIPGGYGQADGSVSIGRDGIVLFTASPEPFAGNVFNNPTRFYEYNYVNNTITQISAPTGATNLPSNTCYEVSFVNLPNGQILCGIMGNTQYYLYTPAGATLSSLRPVISSTSSGCTSYIAYGTNFNGRSLGTVYGDDWQMATNFPIVRLTSGGGVVSYCKSFNWNSYLMRRTAPDTVFFDVPAGLANGTYSMNIIANGVSSLTTSFNTYPSLTSDLTPAAVCSGHPFVYTMTYDKGCVSRTWTRAAVAGISNAAVTTPQNSNINETLINTSATPKTVNYVVNMSNQGYSNTQIVSVVVNPSPNVSITTLQSIICDNDTTILTALGATTYAWDPGTTTGSPANFTPTNTTTYTVTGTNAYGCTDQATKRIYVNKLPNVTASTTDNDLCPGQSTNLSSSATSIETDSILTTLQGGNGLSANMFDIHATKTITITDFKMNINTGTQAEVWYNPGGYGNADVTSTAGWTKLGATVNITPAGAGNLTLIPTTSNLVIPAGQTYGIMIACNGTNVYTNGTLVGNIYVSTPGDLYITEGHGGSGFGGTFNFNLSPRVFNGEVVYTVNNLISAYNWNPSITLSNASISNPVATPSLTTTGITNYTVTATDGNGCGGTSVVSIYTNKKPAFNFVNASPASICSGGNSQLTNSIATSEPNQNLASSITTNNGLSANMFDIHANKPIRITNLRMVILTGDSAEVYYKPGGYGNISVSSSVGWTKLGNTVPITAQGSGAFTTIPTTANLDIPAGATYGIMIACNGTNRYTNGTGVGNIAASNPDLDFREGHGGSGFGGSFFFFNSPRIFNGQIDYLVFNDIVSYSWAPNNTYLNNATITNPIASPHSNTTYTVTATDINGCSNSSTVKLFVDPLPQITTSVSPVGICPGDSAQILVTPSNTETDSLFTTVFSDNGFNPNGGVVFDITTNKQIQIQRFKMNISAGATQAQVYYKVGGYGGANVTSSAGWVQLGSTVNITPAGLGNLTNIPLTAFLTIPASQTYGFVVVTNGSVNYTDGTAVGNVFASNPDLSIKEGHGGSGGFAAAWNFTNSPRVFNGEIVYQVSNAISTYSWAPNTNMNNASVSNPKAAPLTTTNYTVTVTDNAGCSGTGVAAVVVNPLPTLGTATASPTSFCLGGITNLGYTAPAGLGCFGAIQSGFAGSYAPANWTTSQTNSNGTVNTALTPNQVTLTSSNGFGVGAGSTNYSIVMPCSGVVSWNWDYTTTDFGPDTDFPRYSTNGTTFTIFPTFKVNEDDPKHQVGSFSLNVTAGQTLTISAYSTDNLGGAATIKLTNFKAPYQTLSGQSVTWFSAPSAGTNLGNANPQSITPTSAGTFNYYAQVSSSITGCTNTTRSVTNPVTVLALPNTTISATNNPVCFGSSTTLTASGGATYVWAPGGSTNSSITVSPVAQTIYTVTALSANGCTKSSTIIINVNTPPTVNTSTPNGTITCGNSATITANGASTYTWQPGGLIGSIITVNPVVTTTYTVTGTSANGCTATSTRTITVNGSCSTALNVKLYFEGYYLGGGLMEKVLQNEGVTGATSTQCDTITVQLRNPNPPYAIVATQKQILNTNGNASGNFLVSGNYYIVIKHRNGLETWSASPVNIIGASVSYDFTNAANKAYGSNQVTMSGGVFAMYSGDINQDENIDLLDASFIESDITNFQFGYFATDINGDGNVDLLDTPIIESNINGFVFSAHP